jgi:peptide/nickel transport system permease protein
MFGKKKQVPADKKLGVSYWDIVKRQFRKNRVAVWSLYFFIFLLLLALSADFLANEKPYYCVYNGQTYFPLFRSLAVDLGLAKWQPELAEADWVNMQYESAVFAPVTYSPTTIDIVNSPFKGPFADQEIKPGRRKHILGTDQIGRDVCAGMIHGTRIALEVGVLSMAISSLIGIFLGALSGYYGDERLQVSRARLILNVLFLFFAWFYAFQVRSYNMSDALADGFAPYVLQWLISIVIFLTIMVIPNLLAIGFKKVPVLGNKMSVPVDIIIMRTIEIINSIPILLLILSLVAVLKKPSIIWVMVIIGLTGWTGIAKYVRAELLRVRSLEYIEAAQSLGYSEWRIIFRHALPNSLTPVLITIAFGVASAILVESGLSFLGIGVQAELQTWGKLLSEAREDVSAWWLAVFPGLAIFVTVTIFNLIGEGLTDALDPRLKQ